MARTAIGVGAWVIAGLTFRKNAVVTGRTITGDPDMIKGGGSKACGGMAHAAVLRSGNMVCGFACSGGSVMAGGAVLGNADVIETRTDERGRVMAHGAILCGGDVGG